MYPVGTPSCSWGVFEAHFPRYKALIKRIPHWYSFFMHLSKLITMTNYTTLQQLMNSFRQGLFFNLSNSEWKLPNGIARLLEVDETGCCWFLFHVNAEQAVNYDQEFPARIRLYEKGRDCYVEANGKGVILTDPEDWAACSKISYGMAQALRYHGLIVRFRIQHATVTETGRSSRRNFLQKIMDEINVWASGRSIAEKVYPASVLSH